MYNLISSENQRLVKSILNLATRFLSTLILLLHDTLEEFEYEKTLFENIFNVEVDIVSIHRPGPFLEKNNVSLNGIPQTYSDKYFKRMKYLSDSEEGMFYLLFQIT